MEGGLNGALIAVRAVHFGTTISVVGTIFFLRYVAEPALRSKGEAARAVVIDRSVLPGWMIWSALLLVLVSGMAWFAVVAQEMSDLPFSATLSEGMFSTVLLETGFGRVWLFRLIVWMLLAAVLSLGRSTTSDTRNILAPILAATLLGALAWAGHAAATPGAIGYLHLLADALHLIAAGTWVGALVPLAVLLGSWVQTGDSIKSAEEAVRRFSTYGILSVTTLIVSGIVNSFILIHDPIDLIQTNYGRFLSGKIALFLIMLAFAAVNRLVLTPRLTRMSSPMRGLRDITYNTVIEAALGFLVIVIVSILGVLSPAPQD
jgi:putative copper resistance protein D